MPTGPRPPFGRDATRSTLTFESMDFSNPTHFSTGVSALLFVLLGLFSLLLPFLGVLGRGVEAARRAKALRVACSEGKTALRAGYAFLAGTVETDGDGTVAARVAVTQEARNHSKKKKKWHTWDEVSRTTDALPFYVACDSGELVRVEPGGDVLVVDTLERVEPISSRSRKRVSELSRGERIHVGGVLRQGFSPRGQRTDAYRDAGSRGWVLTPRRGERMVLSVEPLFERHARRGRFLVRASMFFVAAAIASWGLLFGDYARTLVLGEAVVLDATRPSTWTTRAKNRTTVHHGVVVDVPTAAGASAIRIEIPRAAYDHVVRTGGRARVPAVVVPGSMTALYLGDRPTLPFGGTMLFVVAYALSCWGLFAYYARSVVPWYEKKKLVEYGGVGWVS